MELMPKYLCYGLIIVCLLLPAAVFAHGTEYEIISQGLTAVRVIYDTGEPLAGVPVLVFPPGETEAAYDLKTDNRGTVCLKPDRPGTWVLQVRDTSGHGARINLEVGRDMVVTAAETTGSGRLSLHQKLLMAACVIIGLAGIALYFRRKK